MNVSTFPEVLESSLNKISQMGKLLTLVKMVTIGYIGHLTSHQLSPMVVTGYIIHLTNP